jgi:hypothetical protein
MLITVYRAVELTDAQRDVWSAITAIQACDAQPTIEAIAQFLDHKYTDPDLIQTLQRLQGMGLIAVSCISSTLNAPVQNRRRRKPRQIPHVDTGNGRHD